MAITGYEQDQVLVEPVGKPGVNPDKDVSVPINWAYNHHYVAWLKGKHAEMVQLDGSDSSITGHPLRQMAFTDPATDPATDTDTDTDTESGCVSYVPMSVNNSVRSGRVPGLGPDPTHDGSSSYRPRRQLSLVHKQLFRKILQGAHYALADN